MTRDIMSIPVGERASITSSIVNNYIAANGELVSPPQFEVTYTAVATNKIKYSRGAWRRLFIDADIEFYPGLREIWCASANPPKHDLWKTTELGKGTYFKGSVRDRLHGSQP